MNSGDQVDETLRKVKSSAVVALLKMILIQLNNEENNQIIKINNSLLN